MSYLVLFPSPLLLLFLVVHPPENPPGMKESPDDLLCSSLVCSFSSKLVLSSPTCSSSSSLFFFCFRILKIILRWPLMNPTIGLMPLIPFSITPFPASFLRLTDKPKLLSRHTIELCPSSLPPPQSSLLLYTETSVYCAFGWCE